MVRNSQNSIASLFKEKKVSILHGKQSQKRYMVSGSLCPLICFFDISYLVSFVVRGQRLRRGRRAMVPPHRRASGGLEPAGRALEPAGRVSE